MPAGDLPPSDDGRSIEVACPGVTLRASVLESGTVRLRYRGSGQVSPRASYAVTGAFAPDALPLIGSTSEAALVCTAELLLQIRREDCHLRVTAADGTVVLEDPEDGGYFEQVQPTPQRGVQRVAAPGEHFYGFGEKTGPFDKRGRTMTFWNTDAYVGAFGGYPPDADPLYQSIPFFVGLRGATAYGVFLDDPHRLRFDMGAADPSRYGLFTAGTDFDSYLFAGPAMSDVLRRYSQLTGRTPLPPRWALGYHQSRWGYFPDAKLLSIAGGFRSRALPADGLWLDIQHMNGFRSWTFDPVGFPDPAKLSSDLNALGFKVVAIVDPGLKVDPAWDVYAAGLAGGHYLTRSAVPYVGEVWPGASVFPDFTSPAARTWWGSLVPRATGKGVQGLWIDMNEPSNSAAGEQGTVPNDLACAGDGTPSTMAELHNVYAALEAKATYEGLRDAVPDRRPFVLTRAGFAGIQRHAAVWTGDAPSTWATLQVTLPMMLGLGLSGVPFVGSDVGGYSGNASPELFARWMQLGGFSPFFRGHVTNGVNDQEPWAFGTEVTDISRGVLEERYRLLPYLYSLFHESAQTGAPVLRPLVYEFQSDRATATLGDQAMLGPFLLVAPVLEAAAAGRAVYLPAGRWFEARSGAIFEGPATFQVPVTLGALPTFVREGAILPKAQAMQWSDQAPIRTLTLEVYPAARRTRLELYEDDGQSFGYEGGGSSTVSYTLERTATGATLLAGGRAGTFAPPSRALVVRVRRVDHRATGVRLSGEALPVFFDEASLLAAGTGYFYDDRDLSLVVAFADRPGFELQLDYDPAVTAPGPLVAMSFHVTVPAGTPAATKIHVASSANAWAQQPLEWDASLTSASGTLLVPRGEWVFYKYTRGDWSTVEKWPGCAEASNRYEQGKAHPVKEDVVWAWADGCP
ncbi:MAG: glycoside hydrolase family 31 protein [Myxococcaceae bacterium]